MFVLQKLSDQHTHFQITFFGHLQMKQNGQRLTQSVGQKVAMLLAYLACNPSPHARAQLAEPFWEDIPPNRFLPNLCSTLSRLLKALKPYIKTTQQKEPGGD